jgi:hypothetical protein
MMKEKTQGSEDGVNRDPAAAASLKYFLRAYLQTCGKLLSGLCSDTLLL